MTNRRHWAAAITALVIGLGATATAQRPPGFSFEPQPRWAEEQETEAVCEAMARECAGLMKDGEINASWGYAELYDAGGYLVGLRTTKSTGCKPLDDHAMLGHRRFRTVFSRDEAPDLDDIVVELGLGRQPGLGAAGQARRNPDRDGLLTLSRRA